MVMRALLAAAAPAGARRRLAWSDVSHVMLTAHYEVRGTT